MPLSSMWCQLPLKDGEQMRLALKDFQCTLQSWLLFLFVFKKSNSTHLLQYGPGRYLANALTSATLVNFVAEGRELQEVHIQVYKMTKGVYMCVCMYVHIKIYIFTTIIKTSFIHTHTHIYSYNPNWTMFKE